MNNGHLSEFFRPERAVRQGCPLSPSLFVITIKLLALYMRHQQLIKGIMSNNVDNARSDAKEEVPIRSKGRHV